MPAKDQKAYLKQWRKDHPTYSTDYHRKNLSAEAVAAKKRRGTGPNQGKKRIG